VTTPGEVTSKKADSRYLGRHDDANWAAQLQAEAEVSRVGLAGRALQRSDKRAAALDEALALLERIAAKMVDPADVDALAMIVTRRLHAARYCSRTKR